jgi:hypothetical protein
MPSQQDDSMGFVQESYGPEFAEVDEVVRAHTPEFAARGFTLMDVTIERPGSVLRSIVFHFANARAGLRLRISSFVGTSSPKRGFSAMISTTDHRKLNVYDYLVRHGRRDMAQLLTDDAPADVRAFCEASVRLLIGLLDNELKPVVEGKTFEETPIDWDGYK